MSQRLFKLAALFEKKYAGKHGYGFLEEAPGADLIKWKVKCTDVDGQIITAVVYGKTSQEAEDFVKMINPDKTFVHCLVEPAVNLLKG